MEDGRESEWACRAARREEEVRVGKGWYCSGCVVLVVALIRRERLGVGVGQRRVVGRTRGTSHVGLCVEKGEGTRNEVIRI